MNAALIRSLLDDEQLPLPLTPTEFDDHYRVENGVRVVDVRLMCDAFSEPYPLPVRLDRIEVIA